MPTIRTAREIAITTSESSVTRVPCDRCLSNIPSSSAKYINQNGTSRRLTWCQSCFEEFAAVCINCEEAFQTSETETFEGELWCRGCFNDNTASCDECGLRLHTDSDSLHCIDEGSYCESCYNELYFFCSYCDYDRRKEDYDQFEIATSSPYTEKLCSNCRDEGEVNLITCSRSGVLLNMDNHDSFYIDDNRNYIWIGWARANLDAHQIHLLEALTDNHLSRLRGIQNAAMSKPKRNIGDMLSRLVNKSKSNLQQTLPQTCSPVHDKIYIGMEIEALGGKFFTYNNSKAMKGKGITMGPHRMLSTELPKGTRMVHDGSIQGSNGQEFLPPIIKKRADWKKIERMVKSLKELDWQSNSSCGFHMHFSHAAISAENPKLVKEIFRIFYYLEPVIFACLPQNRRDNDYCKPISKFFTKAEMAQDFKLDWWYYGNFWKKRIQRPNDHNNHPAYVVTDETGQILDNISFGRGAWTKENMKIAKRDDHYFVGRYIGCNLHALYQKGTIELRYFPSILEFGYIYGWGMLMQAVFDYAIKGGSHSPVAKIMENKDKKENKLQALGKLFGWKDALVKFLLLEMKTHSKFIASKTKDQLMYNEFGAIIQEEVDSEHKRIKHLESSILNAMPIPDLHPNAENPKQPTIPQIPNPFLEIENDIIRDLMSVTPPYRSGTVTGRWEVASS